MPPLPVSVLERAASMAWHDAKMLAAERQRINTTEFRGAGKTLFTCQDAEVMVSGPAGTGKSVACLTRMHELAVNNPGFRGLVARNTRSSLSETGLVTFEKWVLGPEHPLVVGGTMRRYRDSYRYPNGATIVVGGMDKPSKILSAEYDVIYVQQAEELTEEAWETLFTRLRNYKLPFQQIIGDCNPGPPTHWIKGRVASGAMTFLESRHEDNPALWDGKAWTEQGRDYLRKLDSLTGVRKRRLRYGEWVSAEGAIYGDYWDRAVHLIDFFPVPREWPKFRSIDFGYTNPFVVQWWAQDSDGRLYLYRELYQTGTTVKDMADRIKDVERWYVKGKRDEFGNRIPNPEREHITATVTDWDAEDRATLEAEGIPTVPADKRVKVGIEAVQHRLEKAGDGKPRLFVIRTANKSNDAALAESKRPTSTVDEIDGYVWADKANKEEPVKKDDHGCLTAPTLVLTATGWKPICAITKGETVMTNAGWHTVLAAGMTNANATIYEVTFSDSRTLRGTGDHPVWVEGKGYIELRALRYGDIMETVEFPYTNTASKAQSWLHQKPSSTRVSNSAGIPILASGQSVFTTDRTPDTFAQASKRCIEKSTKTPTAQSPITATSTTSTATRSTTIRKISKQSLAKNTYACTERRLPKNSAASCESAWMKPENSHLNGTGRQKDENGTASWGLHPGKIESPKPTPASSAAQSIKAGNQTAQGFALTSAGPSGAINQALTTKRAPANAAANSSPSTSTAKPNTAPVHVVAVSVTQDTEPVFNLTVEGASNFFANGILVHNCDAMRYMVMYFDNPGVFGFSDIKTSGQVLMPKTTATRRWSDPPTLSNNRWRLE